jgi:hypothetical protein
LNPFFREANGITGDDIASGAKTDMIPFSHSFSLPACRFPHDFFR